MGWKWRTHSEFWHISSPPAAALRFTMTRHKQRRHIWSWRANPHGFLIAKHILEWNKLTCFCQLDIWYIRLNICMNIYIYMCVYVCMYVCMYVRMYVRTYVCMYVRKYIYIYIYIYISWYIMIYHYTSWYIWYSWKERCYQRNSKIHLQTRTAFECLQGMCETGKTV